METTRPKKLKNKLKDYLDLAKKEVVKIKRKSGQKFILISEEKFNELKSELATLQKRILSKSPELGKAKKTKIATKKTTKKAIAKKSKV
jgi:PHD/YefM family antitoxin component YafN of YafNO toxin-antitoxin module